MEPRECIPRSFRGRISNLLRTCWTKTRFSTASTTALPSIDRPRHHWRCWINHLKVLPQVVDVVKRATARCVIISACTGDESVPDESGGISCMPRMYLHRFVGILILKITMVGCAGVRCWRRETICGVAMECKLWDWCHG